MVAKSQLVPFWPLLEFAELSKLLLLETFTVSLILDNLQHQRTVLAIFDDPI